MKARVTEDEKKNSRKKNYQRKRGKRNTDFGNIADPNIHNIEKIKSGERVNGEGEVKKIIKLTPTPKKKG